MAHVFYNDIYEFLNSRGSRGASLTMIAQWVYNERLDMFNADYTPERVYQMVAACLRTECARTWPVFSLSQRGVYTLSPQYYVQGELEFSQPVEVSLEKENAPAQDEVQGQLFLDFGD